MTSSHINLFLNGVLPIASHRHWHNPGDVSSSDSLGNVLCFSLNLSYSLGKRFYWRFYFIYPLVRMSSFSHFIFSTVQWIRALILLGSKLHSSSRNSLTIRLNDAWNLHPHVTMEMPCRRRFRAVAPDKNSNWHQHVIQSRLVYAKFLYLYNCVN